MKKMVLIGIFLIMTLLLVSSCKVYRQVDSVSPEVSKEERSKSFELRQIEQINHGDSLYVKMKDGNNFHAIYEKAENDSLKGLFWQKNDKKMVIAMESGVPLQQIESLKVRRFSWGATVGFASGFLIIPAMIGLLAVQQMFDGLTLWQ